MIKTSVSLTTLMKEKLLKDKFNDKDWKDSTLDAYISHIVREYCRGISLEEPIAQAINRETMKGLAPIWFENYGMLMAMGEFFDLDKWMAHMDDQEEKERNKMRKEHRQPLISTELKESRSIAHIPRREQQPSLVVGAGPSVYEYKHIEMLADRGWKGVIVTTERMLGPLLEAGVTLDNGFDIVLVAVDGHRLIIPTHFRDSKGKPLKADGIDGMFVTTIAPQTIRAARQAGITPYYFHGAMDPFFTEDSVTGAMNWMVQFPALAAGGNVGASAFTASLYLWCDPIVLIGMDMGYRLDTPIEETAYWSRFKTRNATIGELQALFTKGHNPDFGKGYRQDPVFRKYSRALLNMIETRNGLEIYERAGEPGIYFIHVINATGGGALHHPTFIKGMDFDKVLDLYGRN